MSVDSENAQFVDSVGYLLVRAARAHRAVVGRGLAKLGLHPGQELLLAALWGAEPLPQGKLIERLQVEPPTVTKALKRMEHSGLVHRSRAPHDGRVVMIELTPAGRALESRVRALWDQTEEALLAGLGSEERERARQLLAGLHANMLPAARVDET
jgi:DNA-binding MarR family transcriptional regulator